MASRHLSIREASGVSPEAARWNTQPGVGTSKIEDETFCSRAHQLPVDVIRCTTDARRRHPTSALSAAGPVEGPDRQARDLADRIDEVVRDPARARRFGQRGRQRVVEHFSWPAIATQTEALYRRLIGSGPETRLPLGRTPRFSERVEPQDRKTRSDGP